MSFKDDKEEIGDEKLTTNEETKVRFDSETGLYITGDGFVLKPVSQWKDKDNYHYVTVNRKNIPVHRLVAKLYVEGRAKDKNIVMHKDDNPENNSADNLQWGTSSENNLDAYRHGLKKNCYIVMCRETGEVFHSARAAAIKMFDAPRRADKILMACREQRGKAYGFHWEVVSR